MGALVPFTPRRALRSAASPLAAGGAAIGVAAALAGSASLSGLATLVGLGWLLGTGGAFALGLRDVAVPRERIDPFSIGEPWRFFVRDALTARNRFEDALRSARPGPLKERLLELRAPIEAGVRECWEIAKQAQSISDARKRLDTVALQRRLESLEARDADTSATEHSVRSQLESAARLDGVLTEVTARLEELEAQLTEAVTRAIEVSALAGHSDDLSGVGSRVDQVVGDLEALRAAMAEMNRPPPGSP